VSVLLEDPPPSEGSELVFDWSDERFFADYYSPVPELLEVREPQPSGVPDVDNYAEGAWLPGAAVWLGLAREIAQLGQARARWLAASELEFDSESGAGNDAAHVHRSLDGHVVVLAEWALEPPQDA